MTDSKEEYKALRDDILGAYKNYRTKDRTYHIRLSTEDGASRFPSAPSEEVIYVKASAPPNPNHELGVKGDIFCAGMNQDFSMKESCFYPYHVKEMDNYGIKYFWTLGKNGLMITKMNANGYDELPRNIKGQVDTNPRISRAMRNQNDKFLDRFFASEQNKENHRNIVRAGKGEITFQEQKELETELHNKFKSKYCKECIDDLDSCLKGEGLYNTISGERLFQFTYVRTGSNKEITKWE